MDETEVVETKNIDNEIKHIQKAKVTWICCAPCFWVQTSMTIQKVVITTATILVTSLLVASPILFLISTAPSQLPRNCYNLEEGCSNSISALECSDNFCWKTASNIQTMVNWSVDPCINFKEFSCSNIGRSNNTLKFKGGRSSQETVDIQMQELLQHNTTFGVFRKLGRLYSSCLRQKFDSSTIQRIIENLGGYLPIGALGPSSLSSLISKIQKLGPSPLIDFYYDLSYGKRPQVLLIINGPNNHAPILENKHRWIGPKAPPNSDKHQLPYLLFDLLDNFLPEGLTLDQKISEKENIATFISELARIQNEQTTNGFWNSTIFYDVASLQQVHPMFNWTQLIPQDWNGPIVLRNSKHLQSVEALITKYTTRVSHNSVLVLFILNVLPKKYPNPLVCTRSTMWALPEITSALFIAKHSTEDLKNIIQRTEELFESLKAHLKRAPSLKGAALVKLSALKIQSKPWLDFFNTSAIKNKLDSLEITSDDWFKNILNIYEKTNANPIYENIDMNSNKAWAYPTIAKIFYDTLSHSIVIPLSVVLNPYFDKRLPPYLHYATVGVSIAKEILKSITKSFDEKVSNCVPDLVQAYLNCSKKDVLTHAGGMQISFHSLLSLTGPNKGMARLVGLELSPTQIYFVILAQDICSESFYKDVHTDSVEFSNTLNWFIAQGGSASDVFKCGADSFIQSQKVCNVI